VTTFVRWLLWSLYAIAWTTALLYPIKPETGVQVLDEFISPNRYLIAKSVHVTAYAVFTILTAWLHAPLRYRWLLMFVLMAHGTATELGQLGMNELGWSQRTGGLPDVGFDNLGVLLGVLLSRKWWIAEP
jgi:hypothetical protein